MAKNTFGIIALLAALGLYFTGDDTSTTNPNPEPNPQPNPNPEPVPPVQFVPITIDFSNGNAATFNFTPWGYVPPAGGQQAVNPVIDVKYLTGYNEVLAIHKDNANKDAIYFTGWDLLFDKVQHDHTPVSLADQFQVSIWQVVLYQQGITPMAVYSGAFPKREVISLLAAIFNQNVIGVDPINGNPMAIPNLNGVNWAYPNDNALAFVSGLMFMSEAGKAKFQQFFNGYDIWDLNLSWLYPMRKTILMQLLQNDFAVGTDFYNGTYPY